MVIRMDRVRKMIGCDQKAVSAYTGKGVYVAVLDSGIAAHPDLQGRVVAFRDFTGSNIKRRTDSYYDDNGHGTHV